MFALSKAARCAVLAVSLFPLAGVLNAQSIPEDCSRLRTQLDMNFCAEAHYAMADRELNRIWDIVKPAADLRGTGGALLDAQRAWLKMRDAQCEAERAEYEGGSIAPMIYWNCMERMTLRRNVELSR